MALIEAATSGGRMANTRRVNRRHRIPVDDRGPTPETKAKVRPDPIQQLRNLGVLSEAEQSAAEDIRTLIETVGALQASAMQPGGSAPPMYRNQHHLDGISPAMQRRYMQQLIPWQRAMRQRQVGNTDALTAVLAAIVGGELGAIIQGVKAALALYAGMPAKKRA